MRDNKIKKVLLIGSGPIVIGQACEFDYSGTQACKALREENIEVVLINSNPATIMTDSETADRTYIEPIDLSHVEEILKKEKPDAILPTLGGQTGLNLGMEIYNKGLLEKYNVKMLGATPDIINKAEDREEFKKAVERCSLSSARSKTVYDLETAKNYAQTLGYPCVIRPAYTLGGTGGGIAYSEDELVDIVGEGLRDSLITSVLIEESIIGWKEYELEVMRDCKDNCVIVCSIENLDAMGVHTGDSITVAPAQTLTDQEYQRMRNAAMMIMREIGVETGGSNVQFAINPKDGRMIVIEMNPRVSRSSALASKATGFPIAKFAAKLAIGMTLDEIQNDITKETPACFEPTIDYVVTKIPRFNFEKFPGTKPLLGTAMRSVGEVMAIGRTFKESLLKALRSLEEKSLERALTQTITPTLPVSNFIQQLTKPNPYRLRYVAQAFDLGFNVNQLHDYTGIDPWFLHQIADIKSCIRDIKDTKDDIRNAKRMGFSDRCLSSHLGYDSEHSFRKNRLSKKIKSTYKLVDTCAGEFKALTPYYYSTYESEDEVKVSKKEKVMILGGGPNRIGQGIEFDYCCVHASMVLETEGIESIMVNSNPETVSTDYDTSDKLYFEPLTLENVLDIYEKEKPLGVITQFGGQTPLKLAKNLEASGVNILGTSPDNIDRAEDRERFSQLIKKLKLKQPDHITAKSVDDALQGAKKIGWPVVVRPSYVLGGAAMRVVKNEAQLSEYMQSAVSVSPDHPVLVDRYLEGAIEFDVDAVSDGKNCVIAGVMEHVEEAGIHSGDSACVFPPYTVSDAIQTQMRVAAKALAKELEVIGLLNIQFALHQNSLYIIEVNPRGSRTVPFISKASAIPWAKIATQVMLGKTLNDLGVKEHIPTKYAVKEAVLPFKKFAGTDPVLSPEMRATGEVMCVDQKVGIAFLKSQQAASSPLPAEGTVVLHGPNTQEKELHQLETAYRDIGYAVKLLWENSKKTEYDSVVAHLGKSPQFVVSLSDSSNELSQQLRKITVKRNIPLITTKRAAELALKGLNDMKGMKQTSVMAMQEYYSTF